MEFRIRDHGAEVKTFSLPRISTDSHPLTVSPPSSSFQIGNLDSGAFDPLRYGHDDQTVAVEELPCSPAMELRSCDQDAEAQTPSLPRIRTDAHPLAVSPSRSFQVGNIDGDVFETVSVEELPYSPVPSKSEMSSSDAAELLGKEWNTFKKLLLQKCPPPKLVSVSSISKVVVKSAKVHEKSSVIPLNELEDQHKVDEQEGIIMSISQQEYVAKLNELKSQIAHAWNVDDRVTSLKLSLKVAKLLMDTSVSQFYPTLFSLATEILDMLGVMVWKRVKQKAEFLEDGTRIFTLPEDFHASDVCSEAKETCYNWFCKIGSVRELLPRIYLELALFPCWQFLLDRPDKLLSRLVMMTRGLAHPLASAYCHLYIAYCGKKMQNHDRGYLLTCINEINLSLLPSIAQKDITDGINSKSKNIIISLTEPTIEYIMRCIFQDPNRQVNQILVEFGVKSANSHISKRCISLILHHLLKELPVELINDNALDLLQAIQCNSDMSFLQCNNFRLLGFRLNEQTFSTGVAIAVVKKIIEVVNQYNNLDDCLKVLDAYADILFQDQMINHLQIILGGIATRACSNLTSDSEMDDLQSIMVKCLTNLSLENALKLEHLSEILNVLGGRSRVTVHALVLSKAIRTSNISEPSTIQFLFKVAQGVHERDDLSFMTPNGDLKLTPLVIRFVQMVDYGMDLESHLAFLVNCSGAFTNIDELKVSLVHKSNSLAIEAAQRGMTSTPFIRSCLTFSELTIQSVAEQMKQLHLYLETSEVALQCNLVGHSDGSVDSALSCLQCLKLINDPHHSVKSDEAVSVIRKLCNLILLVPGNPSLGATRILKRVLTLTNSQSWATAIVKTRTLCGVALSLAALAQIRLHNHIASEEELKSYADSILGSICDTVHQEHAEAVRGILALEACNCIALSFKMNDECVSICTKLVEIAKSCLSATDPFLLSTINFIHKKKLHDCNNVDNYDGCEIFHLI